MQFERTVFNKNIVILAIVAMFLFCSLGKGASVCVHVVDSGRMPLGGATISVVGLTNDKNISMVSNDDGLVCRDDLPEGLYSIEVNKTGFLHVRYYPIRIAPDRIAKPHFIIPLGEIDEGLGVRDVLLSGTLRVGSTPVSQARMCFAAIKDQSEPKCIRSNDFGEYHMSLAPGAYRVEVMANGKTFTTILDLSAPGYYRNKVELR